MQISRCPKDLKRKNDQLVENGKPPKLAITTIIRKLVVQTPCCETSGNGLKFPLDQDGYYHILLLGDAAMDGDAIAGLADLWR